MKSKRSERHKMIKTIIFSLLFVSCVCIGMWIHWILGIGVLVIAFIIEIKYEEKKV